MVMPTPICSVAEEEGEGEEGEEGVGEEGEEGVGRRRRGRRRGRGGKSWYFLSIILIVPVSL